MRVRNTKYSFEKDPCFSSAAGKKNVKETRPRDKERRHFICNSSSDRTRGPCELYSRPSAPSTQNDHPGPPLPTYNILSFKQEAGCTRGGTTLGSKHLQPASPRERKQSRQAPASRASSQPEVQTWITSASSFTPFTPVCVLHGNGSSNTTQFLLILSILSWRQIYCTRLCTCFPSFLHMQTQF